MAVEAAHNDNLFARVDDYDWDGDTEFQGGLQAILGSASSPQQIAHLTLRARCFYYSRKFGTKVNFEGYQAWRSQHDQSSTNGTNATHPEATTAESSIISEDTNVEASSAGAHGNAPTPASFAEICQLIADGKPIPGIKEIPDTVLEGQATTSSAPRRKKPWEKDVPASDEVSSQPTS